MRREAGPVVPVAPVVRALSFAAVALALAFHPAQAKDKVRLKGNLHIGDRHVVVDDSFTVRRPREVNGSVVIGPGIHVETDDASIVRMFSDATVDSLEEVRGSVVSLFGNVIVNGHVTEGAVAVLGSVSLGPGAVVDGDAVAVGGALDQSPTASVRGESVSLTFFPVLPGVPPLRAISLMLLALWVLATAFGGVLALILPRRVERIAETISERTGGSLLLGFFLPPLVVIAAVLLAITVIGIPVAFLLPIAYLLVLWGGLIAASYLIGGRFMGRGVGDSNMFLSVLLGSLVVAVLFAAGALFAGPPAGIGTLGLILPSLGLLFATALAVVGSGAVLLSGFGGAPKESTGTQPSPVPPVPPAGVASDTVAPPATA